MTTEKLRDNNFFAFTLAEVLVTMMVIVLLAVASVPTLKKFKENREAAQDKHSWAAMYVTKNGSESLVVYKDGAVCSDCVSGNMAKFTPPQGINRFNVTVIGGGGGGAAGDATSGSSKTYYPDMMGTDNIFSPPHDGVYRIVAVGGGGGAGGSGALCSGSDGYSGGAVIATANLSRGKDYVVVAGRGGGGGKGKDIWDVLGNTFNPFKLTFHVYNLFLQVGTFNAINLVDSVFPSTQQDGGGRGVPSAVSGDGIALVAGSGIGGKYRRKKFPFSCRYAGPKYKDNIPSTVSGSAIVSYSKVDPDKDRYLCKTSTKCRLQDLTTAVEGGITSEWTFGNGGEHRGHGHNGNDGSGGFVQIGELPVFGGGGGQSGSVAFYSYERSPLDPGSDKTYVEVYVGKGGAGGTAGATTLADRQGKDGQFSRFGNRIIADGGAGGDVKQSNANANAATTATEFKAHGVNGVVASVSSAWLSRQSSVFSSMVDVLYGGYEADASKINGQGHAQNNTGTLLNAIPGTGGGGGGAYTTSNNSAYGAGNGGNGATGLVLVTW